MKRQLLLVSIAVLLCAGRSSAQAPAPSPPAQPETAPEPPVYETIVVAPTPVHGSRLRLDLIPSHVQTFSAEDLAAHHSLDLSGYLGETTGSVHINDVQGNPLQPDLQYRGFLASPLLGAPQGLSMYLDGVRLNEPLGDTINWDLIPANAIRSVNIMPGSNPIFGLNTLGGSLSIETRTASPIRDKTARCSTDRGAESSRARAPAAMASTSASSPPPTSSTRTAGATPHRPAPSTRFCRGRIGTAERPLTFR